MRNGKQKHENIMKVKHCEEGRNAGFRHFPPPLFMFSQTFSRKSRVKGFPIACDIKGTKSPHKKTDLGKFSKLGVFFFFWGGGGVKIQRHRGK